MSIQTEINRLNTAKTDILNSIKNKGVDTSSAETLSDVSSLIDNITTKEDLDTELTQQTSLLSNQSNVVDTIKKALVGKGTGSGETPEYTRVGYIQFTDEQEIDTGIICNQNTKIKMVFTREKTDAHYLYGVVNTGNTASVTAYLSTSGGNWRFGSKGMTRNIATDENILQTAIVQKSGIEMANYTGSYSGVSDFEAIGSLIIGGCRNADGSIGSPQFSGKIYSFEMWDGEEQILKLIPMVNKNGVYGFWDAISETFLTSITDVQLEGGV